MENNNSNLIARKESIVHILKERNRLKHVHLADLRSFIKKHLDPTISHASRKSELLPMVEAYLTADTLLECAKELPRFGLALCDLPNALDISKSEAAKLMASNKLTLLHTIRYTYNPCTIYVLSIQDAVEAEANGLLKHNL